MTTLRIVLGVDDIWFDAKRKRILASGHAGFVSIVQQKDPDRYEIAANIPTGVGGGNSLYSGREHPRAFTSRYPIRPRAARKYCSSPFKSDGVPGLLVEIMATAGY